MGRRIWSWNWSCSFYSKRGLHGLSLEHGHLELEKITDQVSRSKRGWHQRGLCPFISAEHSSSAPDSFILVLWPSVPPLNNFIHYTTPGLRQCLLVGTLWWALIPAGTEAGTCQYSCVLMKRHHFHSHFSTHEVSWEPALIFAFRRTCAAVSPALQLQESCGLGQWQRAGWGQTECLQNYCGARACQNHVTQKNCQF